MPKLRGQRFILVAAALLVFGLPACRASQQSGSPPPESSRPVALRPPEPDLLLAVLNQAVVLEQDAWENFDYPTFRGDFLTSPQARALFRYVEADLQRYYAPGFPDAAQILREERLDTGIWLPPAPIWRIITDGLVAILNEEGLGMVPGEPVRAAGYTLELIPVQTDQGPPAIWMLEVESRDFNLRGWLPVVVSNGGDLAPVPGDRVHENWERGQAAGLQIVPDLDGDGLADLMIILDGSALGAAWRRVRVFGAAPGGFTELGAFQLQEGGLHELDIVDHDGDGLHELRIATLRSLNFECNWQQINLYRWEQQIPVFWVIDDQPADSSQCALAQALSPLTTFIPWRRAEIFEQALEPDAEGADPGADLSALIRVHLAMAYAGMGQWQQASETLDGMAAQSPSSPYADWLSQEWSAFPGSAADFCRMLDQRGPSPSEFEGTDLARYFRADALFWAYGGQIHSISPLVCPLSRLIHDRLTGLRIPASETPATRLQNSRDLVSVLSEIESMSGDGLWAGVSAPPGGWVFTLSRGAVEWQLEIVDQIPDSRGPFQLVAIEAIGLSNDAFVVLAPIDPRIPATAFPDCWQEGITQVQQLFLYHRTSNRYERTAERIHCGPPPDLLQMSAADLEGLFTPAGEDSHSLDAVQLLALLEELELPNTAQDRLDPTSAEWTALIAAAAQWDTYPPEIAAQLLYAFAYRAELQGLQAAAGQSFLDLIDRFPRSPWALLASARIP